MLAFLSEGNSNILVSVLVTRSPELSSVSISTDYLTDQSLEESGIRQSNWYSCLSIGENGFRIDRYQSRSSLNLTQQDIDLPKFVRWSDFGIARTSKLRCSWALCYLDTFGICQITDFVKALRGAIPFSP